MDFKVVYGKRRTISLIIQGDGSLLVKAPRFTGLNRLKQLVETKKAWIEKHQAVIRQRLPKKIKKDFAEGEKFLFMGQEYPLYIIPEYRSRLAFDNGFYLSQYQKHKAKHMFVEWYKDQAKKILSERAKHFAVLMGVHFKALRITEADTRWGSCSSKQTINFSYKLVLAPLEIADSVVVHELAHLIHHNHSKNFWNKVAEFYPNYKQARKWLNNYGQTLTI